MRGRAKTKGLELADRETKASERTKTNGGGALEGGVLALFRLLSLSLSSVPLTLFKEFIHLPWYAYVPLKVMFYWGFRLSVVS